MSDLLSIGTAGLRSYRAALNVTGDNVANAQTPGYARRSVRIAEVAVGSGPTPLYRNALRFDGSEPAQVTRAVDAFRTLDARAAAADHGRAQAVSRWLDTAESALGGDIAPALSTMFANGDRLAADPSGVGTRAAFLGGIADAAGAIASSAAGLARVAEGITQAGASAVDATNADLAVLATINLAIGRQPPGTASFAELEDQRDGLLDAVTAATGARAATAADGTATLKLGDTTLLENATAATLRLAPDRGGRFGVATSTGPLANPGGALAGLASAADTVATRREELDVLATALTATVNEWQARGRDKAGQPGAPLLAMPGDASTIAITTDNSGAVAAASGTSANGNALALSGLRATSGLEASAADIAARQASATAQARDAEGLASRRRDTAAAARDTVEGVDLDREAADLLRYQQAYGASARVIQAARETVDTILALFR